MGLLQKTSLSIALTVALISASHAQTLRYGLLEDPDVLDPTFGRTFSGRMVFAAICDKLIDIDVDLKFVPQLATEWRWSGDRKTLTLKLRPNVKFQDGQDFNADAVKFNLDRHRSAPGSNRRGELSAISNVAVVDNLTVDVHVSNPFAPLVSQLTDRGGMMVSPKAARELGDKFGTAPVCAGPFKLLERIPQDKIIVERFGGYWNRDAIKLDRIEFRPIPDSTVLLTNLRSGQIDLLERLSPTDISQVKQDAKLRIGSTYELGFQYLIINVSKDTPLAKSEKIREALELSIDREALNRVVFNGEFLPGNQWVSPRSPYYVKSWPILKRDVAKAKALLAEAGNRNPKIDLIVWSDNVSQQVAQTIQAMARDSGFDIRIRAVDYGTALNMADQGDIEIMMSNWSGRADPDGNTYNFLACKTPMNYSRYCNEAADAALNAARVLSEIKDREAAWKSLADVVLKERPVIYLYHRNLFWAYTNKLQGFGQYPDGIVRFPGLTLGN